MNRRMILFNYFGQPALNLILSPRHVEYKYIKHKGVIYSEDGKRICSVGCHASGIGNCGRLYWRKG